MVKAMEDNLQSSLNTMSRTMVVSMTTQTKTLKVQYSTEMMMIQVRYRPKIIERTKRGEVSRENQGKAMHLKIARKVQTQLTRDLNRVETMQLSPISCQLTRKKYPTQRQWISLLRHR